MCEKIFLFGVICTRYLILITTGKYLEKYKRCEKHFKQNKLYDLMKGKKFNVKLILEKIDFCDHMKVTIFFLNVIVLFFL